MRGAQLPPPSHSVRQKLSLKLPIAVPVVWLSTELLGTPVFNSLAWDRKHTLPHSNFYMVVEDLNSGTQVPVSSAFQHPSNISSCSYLIF